MTTIAYRDGIVAADGRTSLGGWIASYQVSKVWRLSDGSVVAGCGDYARINAMRDWLDGGKPEGKLPTLTDTTVIHFAAGKPTCIYEEGGFFEIDPSGFAAWGSGSPPALGAMYMGATAAQAVEIASRVDGGTGGEVITMKVG